MKLHINASGSSSSSFVVLKRNFFVTYLTRNTHHRRVFRYILCYFYAKIFNKLKLFYFHQVSLFSDSNFSPTITISRSIITIFLMFPLDIISLRFINFPLVCLKHCWVKVIVKSVRWKNQSSFGISGYNHKIIFQDVFKYFRKRVNFYDFRYRIDKKIHEKRVDNV